MKKKIILFNPKTGLDLEGTIRLPIALLSISSMIHKKYNVIIIDQRADKDWKNTLINNIDNNVLCFGVTSMTGRQILHGLSASKIVKKINKNIKIIWGGVHSSLLPEQTLQNKYVDIIVMHEGELTFKNLVEKLDKKQSYKNLKGIAYKDNKKDENNKSKIKINPRAEFLDLNKLPPLPYHLINVKRYINTMVHNGKYLSMLHMETTRGCPHKCSFCYNNQFNVRRWRSLTPEKIIDNIKQLLAIVPNIESIHFQDDNFFVNKKRVEEFCHLLIKSKLNIKWRTTCKIDYIKYYDKEFLKLLKKAGLVMLYFGIESASNRMLKLLKKEFRKKDVKPNIEKLNNAGIDFKCSFIVGLPTENIKDVNITLDFVRDISKSKRTYIFQIFNYTPFYGTELYDLSVEMGFKPPKTLEEWGYFDFTASSDIPWVSKKQKKIFDNLSVLSLFFDGKTQTINAGFLFPKYASLIRFLLKLYYPIVNLRCRFKIYNSFLDTYFIKRIVSKVRVSS